MCLKWPISERVVEVKYHCVSVFSKKPRLRNKQEQNPKSIHLRFPQLTTHQNAPKTDKNSIQAAGSVTLEATGQTT